MHAANFQIRVETEQDAAALSQLSAQAFGPGRFGRTAYRIREGVAPGSSLALTAWLDDRLVGGIRFTAVTIGGEGGALLLGPLVVDPVYNGKGYGKALVAEGLARARSQGFRLVVLVGDMPYYGRFGFVPVRSCCRALWIRYGCSRSNLWRERSATPQVSCKQKRPSASPAPSRPSRV